MVDAVLIDLEKAFDSVWHNGLIHKRRQHKFNEFLFFIILDMITDTQFITWDGANYSSLTFKIIEGLRQGTVTSPILFNIYNSEVLNLFSQHRQ